MTIDATGAPIVVDQEYVLAEKGDRVFTYRWDGAAWQTFAPGTNLGMPPPAYSLQPTIAMDGAGRLVRAWRQSTTGAASIAVARYQP